MFPRLRGLVGFRVARCDDDAVTESDLSKVDLDHVVAQWSTREQIATQLDVTPAKVRTMVRAHELAGVAERGELRIPSEFIQDGGIVKGLPGLLTLFHDGGFTDHECIAWIFSDLDLPGRPIDALRENRGSEVKRRAQAMAV